MKDSIKNFRAIKSLSKVVDDAKEASNKESLSLKVLLKHLELIKKSIESCAETINKNTGWTQIQAYADGVIFFVQSDVVKSTNDLEIVFGNNKPEISDNDRALIEYTSDIPISVNSIDLVTHLKNFEKWLDNKIKLSKKYKKEWVSSCFKGSLKETIQLTEKLIFSLDIIKHFSSDSSEEGSNKKTLAALRLLDSSLKLTNNHILKELHKKRSQTYKTRYRRNYNEKNIPKLKKQKQ